MLQYHLCQEHNIMCWITKGREIENYIPDTLIKKIKGFEKSKKSYFQFQNMEDFLDSLQKGLGKKFLKDKISFSREITVGVTKNDFVNSFDLDSKMKEVIKIISSWNT